MQKYVGYLFLRLEMDDWMPAGLFCLAHKHFLKIEMTEWWTFKMETQHIKIWLSSSTWRIRRQNSTGLGSHKEKQDRAEQQQLLSFRRTSALQLPAFSFPAVPCTSGWQLPPILYLFMSPLWSLRSVSAVFATDSIKFYSWLNSDHRKAAVLVHTVLANCRISFLSHLLASHPL